MRVKCFWLEPTNKTKHYLRRYTPSDRAKCPGPYGYHNARNFLDVVEKDAAKIESSELTYHRDHQLWPTHCSCGYEFTPEDEYQVFTDAMYLRTDTREEMSLLEAPPGAMWNAHWMADHPMFTGPDGRCLVVRLPNGHDWMIDGEASNCTNPEDFRSGGHKCWVRHGEPPYLTVDKNGKTCNAGGGSILSGSYHGFLRNGEFI
jgi:hypothetical protein